VGPWIAALATSYGAVFLLELPDKTTALTLVLTTRLRPSAVLAGAAVAFALQAAIAVALGGTITLLPDRLVSAVIAIVFGVGAWMLLREGFARQPADGLEDAAGIRSAVSFGRATLTSCTTLFLAEWGDSSQLAAVGVAARYAQPLAVGIGAFLALMCVTLLALFVGGKLRSRVPATLIHRIAGFVFAGFAALALCQVIFG
jgi:putative Ca2+/H+ antiporter (TMEM165/GDT1 family)